jgi:4'-phosphopantetheinyl transferase
MAGDSNTAWRSPTNPVPVRAALDGDEVAVWYALTEGTTGRECADVLARLGEVERARCAALLFEEDRVSFTFAHALLRTALSHHAGADPGEWRFRATASGRPEIDAPASHRHWRFSLSHARGLVACAVTRERDVGVDAERIGPRPRRAALAERCLSPVEKRALAALPPAEAEALFIACWTLKEAYAKARGLGLRLPLDAASFAFTPGVDPAVTFRDGHDDARDWQFALLEPAAGCRLAVAARRAGGAAIRFRALAWRAAET